MAQGTPNSYLFDPVSLGGPCFIDSGASDHMSCLIYVFSYFAHYMSPKSVYLADGSLSSVMGVGTVHLR